MPPRVRLLATGTAAAVLAVLVVVALVALVGAMVGPAEATGTRSVLGRIPATAAFWTPPAEGVVPTSVEIPSLSVSSSLIGLGRTPTGEVAVPSLSRPMQAAWYDESPVPSAIGAAVILGHVNGDGRPGVFIHLRLVRPGAEVLVRRSDGMTAVFRISSVETLAKDAFRGDRFYGSNGTPQLRLVTCGGEFDARTHGYLSNVVVFADLTDVRPS